MHAFSSARTAVRSSSLAAVAYDARLGVLEVQFHSGAVYRYEDVEHDVYDRLMSDESKGAFFNRSIRDRFPFTRVSGGRKPP